MSQTLALLFDELRVEFRRPGTHLFALVYVAVGVLIMVAIGGAFESVKIGVGSGNVKVDSPFTVTALSLAMSLFTSMNVAAISGGAACRDVEEGMFSLVYATPVGKWRFLGTRWLASLAASGWIVAGIPVGLLIGAKLPLLEAERVGAWSAASGVVALVGWVLPNLVLTSALFFGLAALTRRMFPNYIGGTLLLVGYLGAQALTADVSNDVAAALLDPFGFAAMDLVTRYWAPHARNVALVWPVGYALVNRVGWTALGLGLLVSGIGLARLDHEGRRLVPAWLRRRPGPPAVDAHAGPVPRDVIVPAAARSFDVRSTLLTFRALTGRAVRDVIGHRYFWAFVAAAVLFQLLNSQVIGSLYGTETWPVTYQVIEVLEGTLGLFLLIVLTFYAGDLVWHERDLHSAELVDSTPVADALPLVAKSVALLSVIVGMHVTVLITGVAIQLLDGYTQLELGLYTRWLFGLSLLDWVPYVALALVVHAVIDNKVVGHLVLVSFWVAQSFRAAAGFEYNLPWFGSDPGRTYSDMNGWGWFLAPFLLYKAYWIAVGVGLVAVGRLAWVRGTDRHWRRRISEAKRRLDRPTAGVLAGSAAVAVALAAVIFVNTSVARPYRSSVAQTRLQVDYERTYQAAWAHAPQPRIDGADLAIDVYPSTGVVHSAGKLAMENRSGAPIPRMMVWYDADAEIAALTLDRPIADEEIDAAQGLRIWTLATPMAPGERATLTFDLTLGSRGFPNSGANTTIVPNGSFVHSPGVVPGLGYERGNELSAKAERRKYDLPDRPRMLDLDDPVGLQSNYITDDADRVQLDVVVTTDAGQTALAPGALVESGVRDEDGRAWFHYRTNAPILHYYGFLSGTWDVRRDTWQDEVHDPNHEVAIEVWYDKRHPYNVDRMIAAVKASLDAYTPAFGPYQADELRIVEFPRYEQFAQSFPSTIPYSESIGFIARITDPDEDVDYPFYVTAHEVGHQWWAHQVIGADTQGGTVLSETLAQYSALKVMARAYGDDQIHRFLRYEADRYFQGRAFERERELPLLRVEDQGYIHYAKGGIAMWALRERVGEERLDAALGAFLDQWRYVGPPYPTSRDLLTTLYAALPDAADVIHDNFERIVLYENRTKSAEATRNPDGTYTVTLSLALAKTESDAVGEERDVPIDEDLEIGVFAGTDSHREVLHLAPHALSGAEATVVVVVDREPTLAGVDPNHLLLDRTRDDNVVDVTVTGGAPE